MQQTPSCPPALGSPALRFATGGLALAIFVVDALTALDIAVAVLYVVVVLMAADYLDRRGLLLVSAGCLALTVLAYVLAGNAESRLGRRLLVGLGGLGVWLAVVVASVLVAGIL